MTASVISEIDTLIGQMRAASWKERDAIVQQLAALLAQHGEEPAVRDHLDQARKELDLELRWEIDAILEALEPEPEPAEEPEPEPEPEAPSGRLTAKDLVLVYDDPRGFMLHKTKVGNRWFATQRDPYSGQPQTFELSSEEVEKLKPQLAGTPYWVLGSGSAAQ